HFHVSGTILFSKWLGDQIGQALATGALADVDDPRWEPGAVVLEPDFTAMLGLSAERFQDFQQVRDGFALLPSDAVVLNPSPVALDRVFLQTSLGLLLEWQEETPPGDWQSAFDLMVLFDRMRYPVELDLAASEQGTLAEWRRSAEPTLLDGLGIDYVLCRVELAGSETAHCPAAITDHPGYRRVAEWDYAPLYEQYVLYRVGE
ncbi:MAG: hypothetical protein GYB65_19045, partial [Chloroflexi bacterium]|nr:hypothetical protein [Chloroflexota bacterium]